MAPARRDQIVDQFPVPALPQLLDHQRRHVRRRRHPDVSGLSRAQLLPSTPHRLRPRHQPFALRPAARVPPVVGVSPPDRRTEEDGIVEGPPGYPLEFEADVVLSDGGTVLIRPIRPDDNAALARFHERLSPESVYLRYFSPHPHLSDAELEFLT